MFHIIAVLVAMIGFVISVTVYTKAAGVKVEV